MTTAFNLREASTADFPLLQRLHRAGMKDHVTALWGWDDVAQDRLLRDRFEPSLLSVIQCGGVDVGVLQVTRTPGLVRLDNILIDPGHRGRGIGAAIIAGLVAEAINTRARLTLSVLKPNPAKALYERMGFAVVGEDSARYEMLHHPPRSPG